MWLFCDKIAELRSSTRFEMRIVNHISSRVQGRRVAFTSITNVPLRIPLSPTQRAEVEVHYTLDQNLVRELLPTNDLVPREAHTGCKHVVMYECSLPQGTIVDISKLEKDQCRVVRQGEDKWKKSNVHIIPTNLLCPVQIIE